MHWRTRFGTHYHDTYGCAGGRATIECRTQGLLPCAICCGRGGGAGAAGGDGAGTASPTADAAGRPAAQRDEAPGAATGTHPMPAGVTGDEIASGLARLGDARAAGPEPIRFALSNHRDGAFVADIELATLYDLYRMFPDDPLDIDFRTNEMSVYTYVYDTEPFDISARDALPSEEEGGRVVWRAHDECDGPRWGGHAPVWLTVRDERDYWCGKLAAEDMRELASVFAGRKIHLWLDEQKVMVLEPDDEPFSLEGHAVQVDPGVWMADT